MNRLPNVLWIQTDEHRPDSLGCYGSRWAKTPNIDMLAARGVVMQHCVCQSPVCVPSRSSQLTCQYPQEVNVLFNNEVAWQPEIFPEGTLTFPEVFAKAGYETINAGKIHTPTHPTWDVVLESNGGFDSKYATFTELGPGYSEKEYHVVKRPGIHPIIIGGTFPVLVDNPTMKLTNQAIEYMRTRDASRPFVFRVSYNWPHTPVLPPPPFDRLYCPDEIDIQYYDADAVRRRAGYDRALAAAQRMNELSPEAYRQQWRDYMGLVGYVDYEIGRLLTALKALGLEEDTIVVFSSDHGRALGEFGHGEKCTFDEQVWRVPFIWSWPGHLPSGEFRGDLCELVDTGRTLLSLVGLSESAPAHWRGRDLFGSSPAPMEDQAVFGQVGWPNRKAPVLQRPMVAEMYKSLADVMGMPVEQAYPTFGYLRMAIRTQRYRMDVTWMKDGRRVPQSMQDGNLIDLESDPDEKTNLWGSPDKQSVVATLTDKLESWFEQMDKPAMVFGEPS